MGFSEAVRAGFSQYATFSGRASRPAYWWWILFAIVVAVVGSLIDSILGTTVETGRGRDPGIITSIASLALLIPGIAVSVRRLHDTDRSGWWFLLNLLPFIGALILIFFYVQPGTPGPNRYGPPPA
jgi:uncharacterized membrane protein YhaH (DUF805 family)